MSTVRTNTLSNAAGSASVPVDTVISGSAKAWVNFNGTGTVAIRASFNVSSITDNGVGDYTVNFTSAMTDANYATQITAGFGDANRSNPSTGVGTPAVGSIRVFVSASTTGAAFDYNSNNVAVFR
jgi:hypothetical protein